MSTQAVEDKTIQKFAKPDSTQFKAYYAQKRRKKRKERNEEL